MNTYIIIGAPGMGKSPFVREYIRDRRAFVFDIQNEYGDRTKYPGQIPVGLSADTKNERSRYTGISVDEFINIANSKRNTVIVFEEATAFFHGKTEKHLRKYIISRYHTGNVSLFLFHSIVAVPPFIMSLSNYVVMFKTLDEENSVKQKFARLVEPYKTLQGLPPGNSIIIKLI